MSRRKRKLHFAPPTVDGFREILCPLQADGYERMRLIGDSTLANSLVEADWMQGFTVERSSSLDTQCIGAGQVVVLTEAVGEELGQQLLSCVDLENVVVAPVTEWHFSKKPLFLVSIPKAGTHLLYELANALGYDKGVELPEFPKGQTWYCVEYSNSHTVAADFFVDSVRRGPFGNRHHIFMHSPTLFIYRHPLDILVSEAHYYHQDGKTAFAGWLSQCDFNERLKRLLDDNWLLGSLRNRIGGFLPWLEFPNVISFSFEELVGAAGGGSQEDQRGLIWSIQLKLQVPGDPDEIAMKVFNSDSPTFRSGTIGGYADYLSPDCIADFAKENTDMLQQLGYPCDGTKGLPAQKDIRRRQGIRYSLSENEGIPLIVESDFLDCNLVRFRGRIYAIPKAAGLVEVEALSPDALAALPSGSSLSEIKAFLLIGRSNYRQRKLALSELADALKRKDISAQASYWNEALDGCIVDVYQGFNIVAWHGYYLGLRQSIGPIELSDSLVDVVKQFKPGEVLVSQTVLDLHADIDGISTSMRMYQRSEVANEQFQAVLLRLEEKYEKLNRRVIEQGEQFDCIQKNWIVRFMIWVSRLGKKGI